MNVIDLEHRLVGCYGIVGGSIAAATGVALALKRRGGVAVAFFGDGATNQGYFHECLNFAKVHELPVVYVCENNRYGEFTPFEQVTAGEIADRPRTLGLPTVTIDGNDVWTVRATAAEVVERARARRGPAVRRVADLPLRRALAQRPGQVPQARRARRVEARATRCSSRAPAWPSATARRPSALDAVDAEVEEQLQAVIEAAKAAPFPDPGEPVTEFKA